jgi:(S)-2-hydroxy-acid oxidase
MSRACKAAGVAMGLSSFSNSGINEVVAASEGQVSFGLQLYILRNRDLVRNVVQMAEAGGIKAILLTADSPILGTRWNETRNNFSLPPGLNFPIYGAAAALSGLSSKDVFANFNDDGHNWDRDIPWLRSITKMQIWIKGSRFSISETISKTFN